MIKKLLNYLKTLFNSVFGKKQQQEVINAQSPSENFQIIMQDLLSDIGISNCPIEEQYETEEQNQEFEPLAPEQLQHIKENIHMFAHDEQLMMLYLMSGGDLDGLGLDDEIEYKD